MNQVDQILKDRKLKLVDIEIIGFDFFFIKIRSSREAKVNILGMEIYIDYATIYFYHTLYRLKRNPKPERRKRKKF